MEGSRRASMDLPEPGEPTSSTLCPPEAAISSARFTFSCPMTSEKSGMGSVSPVGCHRSAGGMGVSPRRCASSWATFSTGYTVMPSASVASAAFRAGT